MGAAAGAAHIAGILRRARAILGAHDEFGGWQKGQTRVKSEKIARYRQISRNIAYIIIAKYRGDDIVKGYGEGRDRFTEIIRDI